MYQNLTATLSLVIYLRESDAAGIAQKDIVHAAATVQQEQRDAAGHLSTLL